MNRRFPRIALIAASGFIVWLSIYLWQIHMKEGLYRAEIPFDIWLRLTCEWIAMVGISGIVTLTIDRIFKATFSVVIVVFYLMALVSAYVFPGIIKVIWISRLNAAGNNSDWIYVIALSLLVMMVTTLKYLEFRCRVT